MEGCRQRGKGKNGAPWRAVDERADLVPYDSTWSNRAHGGVNLARARDMPEREVIKTSK